MARAGAALLLAAVMALALVLAMDPGRPPGAGTFPVEVVGPGGPIFTGNVSVEGATAYTVLLAAAAQGGFDVHVQGSGEHLFVTAIAGHSNQESGGWCYAVWDGRWVRPPHSAAVAGLVDGQGVQWVYEEDGCGALG